MRVAHFVPAYRRLVDVDVLMSFARESHWCGLNKWIHMPFYVDAHGVARARNQAVREAYEHEADLLLMQDGDCFPLVFSGLEALFRTMNKSAATVVGAAVPIRNAYADGPKINCEPAQPGDYYDGDVGTGLMLIDLRHLRDLPRPWFVQTDTPDGERSACGEDIAFCRKVRAFGKRVVVDYTFPVGHTMTSPLVSDPTPRP